MSCLSGQNQSRQNSHSKLQVTMMTWVENVFKINCFRVHVTCHRKYIAHRKTKGETKTNYE